MNVRLYHIILYFFFLVKGFSALAQERVALRSPNGNLTFTLKITDTLPLYQIAYKDQTLINNSELTLDFKSTGKFGKNMKLLRPQFSTVDENYDLVVGKNKTVRNRYRQVIFPLVEKNGIKRKINLVVRAFNDGIAFRFEFPKQKRWSSFELIEERSIFNIAKDPMTSTIWWDRKQYTNNHEGIYKRLPFSELPDNKLIEMPTLFEFSEGIFMAITEAALRDYAGMYLLKNNNSLKSELAPLPGQEEIKVKATLPHRTPWRVMMISDRIGTLIESNILTNLNEPNKIKDVSWIKPGKTTFHWWNGDVIPDSTITPGINFEFNKYYIDFAAKHDIEYHAVIGYGEIPWYQDNGINYGHPGSDADARKQKPGLNLKRISDYAQKKGVGIHVWVHWKAIYPHLEETFALFEKWGVDGMMIDYLDRADQEMVQIQEEILQKAAEHKLYVQFHGVFKPTGLHRTYPNEFTREATWNYERNKWINGGVTPDQDILVPFTRLLAGVTDYHLGGFRAVPQDEFKNQFTRPLMLGTRAHMLAMYVVLESYLASLCDYPNAYINEPGFDFLTKVPTTWDETQVVGAKVGKHITIARRKGTEWYVGSLNNSEIREIEIPLDFLEKGEYKLKMYSDASDVSQNPNHLKQVTKIVKKEDVIYVRLASGGGQVMHLVKK